MPWSDTSGPATSGGALKRLNVNGVTHKDRHVTCSLRFGSPIVVQRLIIRLVSTNGKKEVGCARAIAITFDFVNPQRATLGGKHGSMKPEGKTKDMTTQ